MEIIIGSSDYGFCDRELENTDHGEYTWNETYVGNTDQQKCVFGPKDGFPEIVFATRACIHHEQWMEYDSTACLSERTYRLRRLSKVNRDIVYIFTVHYIFHCVL